MCDINEIQYFEEERDEFDLCGKNKVWIALIVYENEVCKSVKCTKRTKAISKWFGKELLYLLRSEYDKKKIELEYN